MKKTILAFLCTVSTILAADDFTRPALYDTNGEAALKGSRAGQFFTEQSIRFNIAEFVYRRCYRKTDGAIQFNNSCRLGFRNTGHAGAISLSYPGPADWPMPEGFWTAEGEKTSAVSQLTVPVLLNGRRDGVYSFRILQMPHLPDWLFIRLDFDGTPPGTLSWNFDGNWVEFDGKYSKNKPSARIIHLEGKSFSGQKDKIPAPTSGFFSFGVYALNTPKLERISTILLAKTPDSCKPSLNFRRNSQNIVLQLNNLRKLKSSSLYFALGNFKDSPGRENVEKFYADGGKEKIAGILSSLSWDPVMSPDELKSFPGQEQTRLKELFQSGKFDEYYRIIGVGRRKNEKVTKAELDALLE